VNVDAPDQDLAYEFGVGGYRPGEQPVVWELFSDDVWREYDLRDHAGGPGFSEDFVTWTDPKDGCAYAAGVSSGTMMLYRHRLNDHWSYRSLTGATVAAGTVNAMVSPDGIVNLTALTADGDLIRYYQDGSRSDAGDYGWQVENIGETQLRANGLEMPAWVGETVSYATSWGGLNVAGLDADGSIWSVWWAPGQVHWQATDLSTAYGADPIAGGLTVYLTTWDGINIAGIDNSGHLQVTWWVPSFGGTWEHNDLTAETGGPTLDEARLCSYVADAWGGLNVAGLNRATGDVQVYWWAPDRTAIGWAVTNMSETVGSQAPVMTELALGLAPDNDSLNIFGDTDEGERVRYYWEPGFGGVWLTNNLFQDSIPV
jgi:hypothetical protein